MKGTKLFGILFTGICSFVPRFAVFFLAPYLQAFDGTVRSEEKGHPSMPPPRAQARSVCRTDSSYSREDDLLRETSSYLLLFVCISVNFQLKTPFRVYAPPPPWLGVGGEGLEGYCVFFFVSWNFVIFYRGASLLRARYSRTHARVPPPSPLPPFQRGKVFFRRSRFSFSEGNGVALTLNSFRGGGGGQVTRLAKGKG